MLPDWPTHKSALFQQVLRLMHAQARGKSLTSMVRPHPVFEGHGFAITRADGSEEISEFKKASGEVTVPIDVIKTGILKNAVDAMEPVTTGIAKSMSEGMLETMEEAVRAVGNEVDGEGKPISVEKILEALDKMLVDFDENGEPNWPTFIFNPGQIDHVQAQLMRIQNEPEVAKRFAQITEKKRAEWSAREARASSLKLES